MTSDWSTSSSHTASLKGRADRLWEVLLSLELGALVFLTGSRHTKTLLEPHANHGRLGARGLKDVPAAHDSNTLAMRLLQSRKPLLTTALFVLFPRKAPSRLSDVIFTWWRSITPSSGCWASSPDEHPSTKYNFDPTSSGISAAGSCSTAHQAGQGANSF